MDKAHMHALMLSLKGARRAFQCNAQHMCTACVWPTFTASMGAYLVQNGLLNPTLMEHTMIEAHIWLSAGQGSQADSHMTVRCDDVTIVQELPQRLLPCVTPSEKLPFQ